MIKFTDEELRAQRLVEAETVAQQSYSIGCEAGYEAAALLTDTIRASETENKELRAALNQTSHYLVLSENGWGIEHLVSCRLSGLTNCEIHLLADNNSEMFREWTYGRYEISLGQDGELIIEEAENG